MAYRLGKTGSFGHVLEAFSTNNKWRPYLPDQEREFTNYANHPRKQLVHFLQQFEMKMGGALIHLIMVGRPTDEDTLF